MLSKSNQITHPLSQIPCGTVFYVSHIDADAGLAKRLQEMGFVHQAPVVKTADQGTVICQVGHTQVVLSAEIARQIFMQAVAVPLASETTLDKLKPGQKARVVRFLSDDQGVFVLQEMGLTHHEILELVRVAPLGDPLEVRLRGYELSLRREQARQISVEIIP